MDFKTKVIEAFNDKLIITSDSVFIYTPMGVIFNFINDETLEYSIDGNIHTFYDKDGKTTVEQIKEHFRLRFAKKKAQKRKEQEARIKKALKEREKELKEMNPDHFDYESKYNLVKKIKEIHKL